jgi:hypothetical protein
MIAGRQVQLTLRDTSEERLLARLQTVLERFPVEPKPQPQGTGEGWCSKHSVAMTLNNKNSRQWWSHKTADGQWCKGR